MQDVSLSLIHVAIYVTLLLFTGRETRPMTFRSEVILDMLKRRQMVSEIKTAIDVDNSSYVSKRQAPLDLDWFGQRDIAIWKGRNRAAYYPIRTGNRFLYYPIKHATLPGKRPTYTNNDTTTFNPSNTRSVIIDAAMQSSTRDKAQVEKLRIERTRERISSAKCEEYAEDVWRTIEVLPPVGLIPRIVKVRRRVCPIANPLVSGGAVAAPDVYAHVTALGRRTADGTFVFQCVGSLISHRWILTAAHCTYGPDGGPTVVRLGVHNLREQRAGVTVPIKKAIRHPAYRPPAMYADIALLELQWAVTFSASVRPACLYQRYDGSPLRAWISGWGGSEFDGERNDKLRHARLDVVDNLSCAMHYNSSMPIPHGVSPSMICAGDLKGNWVTDTCPGDSGGPLQTMYRKKPCMFQIVGVTSFGEACATKSSPGVYTRVSHYLTWIETIIWRNSTYDL